MKAFVFIIATGENQYLHVGYCTDILKAVKFYKDLPTLFFKPADFSKLVYVEEHSDMESAVNNFREISAYTDAVKREIITGVNPDYIDLKIGINFEFE